MLWMLSLEQIETFLLVFIRVSAIVFSMPILGVTEVPRTARIGLSFLLAWILFPSVAVPYIELEGLSLLKLLPAVTAEIMIGIMMGLSVRMIFEGIQLGGQLIGFQMGFGIVRVIDPLTGSQYSIIAQVQNLLAVLLFLSLGLHRYFLQAIRVSFEEIPLLYCYVSNSVVEWFMGLSSTIFVTGMKVAGPVMALLLFVSIIMGMINKFAQGMNVMIVMFPLKIAAGLIGIGISLPMFALVLKKIFSTVDTNLLTLIQLAHQ